MRNSRLKSALFQEDCNLNHTSLTGVLKGEIIKVK